MLFYLQEKRNRAIPLAILFFMLIQGCLFSESRETVSEGSIQLSNGAHFSIGDTFESLQQKPIELEYLESSPGGQSYTVTNLPGVVVDIDHDRFIRSFSIFFYPRKNIPTEIDIVVVDGIEVSGSFDFDDLIKLLHDRSLPYEFSDRVNHRKIVVDLHNGYKVWFRFLDKTEFKLESVLYYP